jgi:hypothetical protein
MTKSEQIHVLRCALEWCLTHGVKGVSWSTTGYWQSGGGDGREIMPSPEIHVELDRARRVALQAEGNSEEPK